MDQLSFDFGPSTFKKATPPPIGPVTNAQAFDSSILQMPGGATLMFDTSKLTLADFRVMRDHPQVNASLTLIMFMLHQLDWEIKCEDSKIANAVEENMREIWTRLVRSISQSFWAGYSPSVLEWKNAENGKYIFIDKIIDLPPEECQVNWKEVEPGYRPPAKGGVRQIAPKVKIYDGISKYGLGYPIPPELTFWYPIMMENNNHYGRKLLKAAFQPWYFSMIIHIFANRYFERFGEPTPVGRAPFDEEFKYKRTDGTTVSISGKQAMEEILMNIRSRGQVVLPSDRDPTATSSGGRSEYLWDIEYLESQMRNADFERYLARLDEEISLSIFTPMLLMRSGDVGSHNLGVQHTQCVDPSTPILCADLVWRPAGELKAGQEIVAFDEDENLGQGRGVNARAFRTATIIGNIPSAKPSMRITTDIGEPVTASVDHPWLVWRNRAGSSRTKGLVWVETKDLCVGDQIAHLARPWERETSFDAGWVSGMFDGEGCMSINRAQGGNSQSAEISFVQIDGPVMDKMKSLLGEFGVQASITGAGSSSLGSKPQSRLRIGGGFVGAIEFVGRFAPERFISRASELWEGKGVRRNQTYELATVTSIEDVGMNPVASIQTSTGTFITGGYLTHNTWLWSLNALAGDLKEYIDRYICQRIKAFNFSEKAPRVEWVPRKMGKDSPETIRTIINALISNGYAKPNLEEMGTALGMTLEEIKEATQPTADPNANPQDTRGPRAERNRSGSGPRRVGEPLATGREIAARIGGQVKNAWNDLPNAQLSMGFRKRFAESLVAEGCDHAEAETLTAQVYSNMEKWLKVTTSLGSDEFAGPQDFVSMFERRLTTEIESLATR